MSAPEETNEEREKALDRIRKLLNVAGGAGATDAEVETYMVKARALMDKMNVTEDEIRRRDPEAWKRSAYDSIRERVGFSRAGGLEQMFYDLGHAVCRVCEVQMYRSERYMENPTPRNGENLRHLRKCVVFFGLPADVDVAVAMMHELVASMHTMARLRCGKGKWTRSHMDYSVGFCSRLHARAVEMTTQPAPAAGPASSTAIVLVKKDLIRRHAEEKLSLRAARRTRGQSVRDTGAHALGANDANSVSLGRQKKVGGGTVRGQLS